jgi:predicted exporter
MTELCLKIYRFFRAHRWAFWATMLLSTAFFGYFAAQIHLEEDIAKLLPSSKNEDGSTKLAFADLRIKDKTFLLFQSKNGATPDDLIEVCDAFADTIRVRNAAMDSATQVVGDLFYTIPDDLMPDALSFVVEHLPAYVDTADYAALDTLLTPEAVQRQMEANYKLLTSPMGGMLEEAITADPIGLRTVVMNRLKSSVSGLGGNYAVYDSHFFTPDTTVAIIFITPNFSSFNTGKGAALFSMLNEEIERFAAQYPDVDIMYHGAPARGAYNSWQIKADLRTTIIGSLIVVLIFIFICFRNYNTIPLLIAPVAFGTLFGLAMMYFIKGQFSLLALGIGAIVLGVALSYTLHVLTHYKYVSDPEQVLRDQVVPVSLGCLTTIGSFMGLIFIRTELLQDFGLFASFAIVGTTFFSLIFLPQFFDPAKNKRNRRAFALIDKINVYPFDTKKPLLITIGLIAVVCIACYFVGGTTFDADMRNLGYLSENVTRSEKLLQDKTRSGMKQQYFAASGSTMEEALANFERMAVTLDSLKAEGLVKSYTPTNKLFIPLSLQQERIDAWHAYWTEERLAQVRQLISDAAPMYHFNPEAFEPFFDLATDDLEPAALYDEGIIPAGLLSTLMEKSYGHDYLCFTSVTCENDSVRGKGTDYNRICDAVASQPNLMVLDTYYYTTDTLLQLNDDFNILQWVSMGFVFLVLLCSFRSLKLTLLGFFPILVSWLIVLGAMVIFGVRFNLINIIISTFIFGIGVDYSIFVMNGLLGAEKDVLLLSYHKTAILFSAVVLIVTVASMLFAEHPAIRSVGFATLVGMISAVVIAYVVQPFLFRWMMNIKRKR